MYPISYADNPYILWESYALFIKFLIPYKAYLFWVPLIAFALYIAAPIRFRRKLLMMIICFPLFYMQTCTMSIVSNNEAHVQLKEMRDKGEIGFNSPPTKLHDYVNGYRGDDFSFYYNWIGILFFFIPLLLSCFFIRYSFIFLRYLFLKFYKTKEKAP